MIRPHGPIASRYRGFACRRYHGYLDCSSPGRAIEDQPIVYGLPGTSVVDIPGTAFSTQHPCSSAYIDYTVSLGAVASIEYVRTDRFYDLHVPVAEHYIAHGFINHNSGKSFALIYEALFLAGLNPGLPGLIGAPTYPMLRDATLRTVFEILNTESLPYTFQKTESILTLPSPPFYGAQILFRSLDEFERLRGTNLAWFGIDELTYCPPEAWTRLVGRLRHTQANRREGFAAWTPNGFDWVYQMFIASPKPQYKATLASPRENRYVTDTGLYDALEAGYDERLYRQEVLGEYLALTSNAAYYSFDRQHNVTERADFLPNLPLCWSLDFNVNPMCSVIAQIEDRSTDIDVLSGRRNLRLNVIDELYLANSNTPEACEEFVRRIEKWQSWRGPMTVYVYGDATGNKRTSVVGAGANTDWNAVKEFFRTCNSVRASYKYSTSNPMERERVGTVNAALCNAQGERKVAVHPRCKHLIQDFERVAWKPGTTALDKVSDPGLTHISDAAGYLIYTEMNPRNTNIGFH